MKSALIPTSGRSLPLAVRGAGVWIFDEDGKDYLDGSSGAIAASLGQCHPQVVAGLAAQAETLTFAHRVQFRNSPAEGLANRVVAALGGEFSGAVFVNSGSEANELALKIAFLYWAAQGQPEKTGFVTTNNSYHGNTIASVQISGQPKYAANIRPLMTENYRFRAPYLHRIRVDEGVADPAPVVLDRLREDFASIDHRRTAAVLVETVGGASAGALVPPPGYFELLRDLCDEYGLLWIADEVMTGFGRTGKWFGFHHWDAEPDLVTFAKGVSGGHAPLGGVAVSDGVLQSVLDRYGWIGNGHTYSNNPVTAAVGVATMDVLENGALISACVDRGFELERGLNSVAASSSTVVDVRGIGLMWALEFGRQPSGEPLPSELNATQQIVELCADEGLLVYPARGGVDGVRGDAIMLAPPLVISPSEVQILLQRLGDAIARFEAGL